MSLINRFLDKCRLIIRGFMKSVAKSLNKLTNGRLSPNAVTLFGLFMHLPIAWLIANGYFIYGALGLVVFGLFDALDGELARLQERASSAGMVLDASTDRMKEVILYSGAAYAVIAYGKAYAAVWAVAACGASLCVSYVKAKGETAMAGGKHTANEVNRLFQDGLLRFEVRMAILVIGLMSNNLVWALVIITILSTYTAFDRLIRIFRALS